MGRKGGGRERGAADCRQLMTKCPCNPSLDGELLFFRESLGGSIMAEWLFRGTGTLCMPGNVTKNLEKGMGGGRRGWLMGRKIKVQVEDLLDEQGRGRTI